MKEILVNIFYRNNIKKDNYRIVVKKLFNNLTEMLEAP